MKSYGIFFVWSKNDFFHKVFINFFAMQGKFHKILNYLLKKTKDRKMFSDILSFQENTRQKVPFYTFIQELLNTLQYDKYSYNE